MCDRFYRGGGAFCPPPHHIPHPSWAAPKKPIVDRIKEADKFLISNHFNKFFLTISQKRMSSKHISVFLTKLLQSIFSHIYTSRSNSRDNQSLNNKKAIGTNSIPAKVLNVFGKTVSSPSAKRINLSFNCGVFPMCLKVASVTPIHKKVTPLIAITTIQYRSHLS